MVCVECWALVSVVLLLVYKWSTSTFNVFAKRGIPHYKPLPFIGNGFRFLTGKEGLHKIMLDIYRDTKQHKIFGFYNFRNPFFIVNDPEIIKKLAVKDFDSFANHMKFFDNESDPVIGGMLNVMRGQRWKDMRNTITPTFTGAKLRGMFTLMNDCFAEGMKYFHGLAGDKDSIDIELKDCFSRLSIDLIATTAFGIKLNSFVDRNNDFYTIGQSFTNSKGSQGIKFMLYSIAPKVCKLLGIRPLDEQKINYFNKIVNDTMRQREEQNIVRPDVIQLLMQAEKDAPGRWKREELFAQCFTFFFAAFDNNATLICCACQELMQNPDIQQQLFEEVQSVSEALQGKTLDFETLKGMKYLDMVISETLRKWTLAALTDRECAKDYRVEDAEGNFVCELKQGDNVWFHTVGLHWDPNNFEEPEVFRPERFSEENKHNIKPFTYFPFGLGPRVCIGNRYAIMQAKAMLYYLLKDFRIERCSKSVQDLMQEIRGFQMDPKGGFWFKLVKRQ